MKKIKLKDGRDAVIRDALPDDAARILEITKSVMKEGRYSPSDPDEIRMTIDDEKLYIQDYLDGPGKAFFVAEINGRIIGLITFENGPRRRLAHTGILGILILKEFRELGLGRALLETALKWAENNPLIEKVSLTVFSSNHRSINLCRKYGFIEEGRRVKEIKFGDDDYSDDILMYKFV